MSEEVTCLQLWKYWLSKVPNDPYVLEAHEKMKQYSKQDWASMGEEATDMMERMVDSVKNSQKFLEDDFDRLCAHLEQWFFKLDRPAIEHLALCARFDDGYISFFNKYADGLNMYVYNMIKQYSHKLPL